MIVDEVLSHTIGESRRNNNKREGFSGK